MTVTRVFSIFMVGFLLLLLISVRFYEVELFNDPLQRYFHSDFQLYPLPDIVIWKVITGTSLRYLINTVISLWLLWFLYKKENYINAALWVYLFAYLILIIAFALLLDAHSDFMKMALFYIRRFLIQPLLLFILAAGFYFLKTKRESTF